MKQFTSKTQKTGRIGEKIAMKYLSGRGFGIIEQNFTRKCGEIDIIAQKGDILHFVEVKTVSRVTSSGISAYDNLTRRKLARIIRAIRLYLAEKHVSHETKWQIDAVFIELDDVSRRAKVEMLQNIIL